MQFVDKVSIDESTVKRTVDGYLVASSRVSRAGNVQLYTGDEMKQPGMEFVRVFRPESEVFSTDSMASIAHKPMTNNHPAASVTADTWKLDSIGQMGDEVTRDGEYIRVPLIMMDGTAIKDYEGGKRELSLGYTADVEMVSGLTDSGEAYDAIQRNIRVNHVALVDQGRANQELRIGDGAQAWGFVPLNHDQKIKGSAMTMLTVVLGDKAVQVAATDAPAIEAFKVKMADAEAKLISDRYDMKMEMDAMMGRMQAEIDDLKDKMMDEDEVDKRVMDRAELIGKAKLIAKDLAIAGLSDADIRKATVVAKLGDSAVKDKSAAYIDARFDILAEDSATTTDPLRNIGQVQSNDGAGSWSDSTFASAGIKMKKGA